MWDCSYCDKKKCTVCRCTFNYGNENKVTVGHPIIQYWCSECDAILDKCDKYCHNCGCKIDWEEEFK